MRDGSQSMRDVLHCLDAVDWVILTAIAVLLIALGATWLKHTL